MGRLGGFRPGAGRKSKEQKLLDAGFVCKAFGPAVQAETWKKMLASKDERIVLDAAKYLTDRLYGKAREQHDVTGDLSIQVEAEDARAKLRHLLRSRSFDIEAAAGAQIIAIGAPKR